MTIAEYLRKQKMSQADFARKIGVSKQALRHYIKGNCYPPLDVAHKILHATNGEVSIADLLDK